MKYLEEINAGDCFVFESKSYILTIDFKKNGDRLSYRLDNGNPIWLKGNALVTINPIYHLDIDNNIIPIKTETKTDVAH